MSKGSVEPTPKATPVVDCGVVAAGDGLPVGKNTLLSDERSSALSGALETLDLALYGWVRRGAWRQGSAERGVRHDRDRRGWARDRWRQAENCVGARRSNADRS